MTDLVDPGVDLHDLLGTLKQARLAAKWVVNHAHRAHEYDRPYAEIALHRIEDAIKALEGK